MNYYVNWLLAVEVFAGIILGLCLERKYDGGSEQLARGTFIMSFGPLAIIFLGTLFFGKIPVLLKLVIEAIGFIVFLISWKRTDKEYIEKTKRLFYEECLANGISELLNESNVKKATLIAEKYKINYTDISSLFEESKGLSQKEGERKTAEEILNLKSEEQKQFNELNRYSHLSGRDKKIAMLEDMREEALQKAKKLNKYGRSVYNSSQTKEKNTGLHAGIANGIAGGAAGLATALEVQEENRRIRTQNENNKKAVMPIVDKSFRAASEETRKAKDLLKQIEEVKTKLVSDEDAKTCLSKIVFSETKVDVTKTGTCIVSTKAILKNELLIFDDVKAMVDGTIIAEIYDDNSLIGKANLVVPLWGIKNKYKQDLTGMCLYCGTGGKNYSVKFSATNLWAMEI